MTTSNRLLGNIWTIYMATAQSTIFWLLCIYHFATAHLPIIYLLQIDQLFHHWKLSKYLITLHWKIVWQLHIAYLETFRRCIWLLCKAQFLGYWASVILLLRISQLFMNRKSTKHFTTGNRLHNWLLCTEKIYVNFKSPICKHINDLYGYCAKHNFFFIFHLSFCYCAFPNYFFTANRRIISPLEMV
jgi:hypothetical protein